VASAMADFFKFPSTVHLAFLGETEVREDKCMSRQEREESLSGEVIVEEKVDGANLGISFDEHGNVICQNRGAHLVRPFGGQWRPLQRWIDEKMNRLFDLAEDRLILFGEWCYARHSVNYDALPDWFILFDVYDKVRSRFYSVMRRNAIAESLAIPHVPEIDRGHFTFNELAQLEFVSSFGHEIAEGIYLRSDSDEWLEKRAKLVRPQFRQSIEGHWAKHGIIQANRCVRDVMV